MNHIRLFSLLLIFILLLNPLLWGAPQADRVRQEEPAPAVSAQTLTHERIQAKITEIEGSTEIEEGLKSQLLELYRQALSRLDRAAQHQALSEQYKDAIQTAPQEILALKETLEKEKASAGGPPLEIPADAQLKDLEGLLAGEQAEQADLKQKVLEYESKIKGEQDRPARARQELSEARMKLEEIDKEIKAAPPANENAQLNAARATLLEARKMARRAEVNMLDQEELSRNARLELLTALRDRAAAQLVQADIVTAGYQARINELRKKDAEEAKAQAEQAELEAMGKHPVIQEQARINSELSQDLASAVAKMEEVTGQAKDAEQLRGMTEADSKNARDQVEKVGLTRVLGEVLRSQRNKLPDLVHYRQKGNERREEISTVNFKLYEARTAAALLDDMGRIVEQLVEEQNLAVLSERQRARIEKELQILLASRKEIQEKRITAYDLLVKELGDLEYEESLLMDRVAEYAEFLDERLLWIPSMDWPGLETVKNLGRAFAWLCNPLSWMETGQYLLQGSILPWSILAGVLAAGLLLLRFRLRGKTESIAEKVGKVYHDSFVLTLKALLYTLLLTAPYMILMLFASRLLQGFDAPNFAKALGRGLENTASVVYVALFFWYLCAPSGIAHIHFRWSERNVSLLRRHLMWFMTVLFPSLFVFFIIEAQPEGAYKESLGRLAFVVTISAFGLFVYRILNPKGGVTQQYLATHPDGWLARLKYVWFPAAVIVPFVMVVLSIAGYDYSAIQLADDMFATVILILGVQFLHDFTLRAFLVAQRRLALEKAKERRAEKAEQESREEEEGMREGGEVSLDLPEMDISTISEQTHHLLRVLTGTAALVGLWLIWAGVLPALGIFEEVALWHYSVEDVDGIRQLPVTITDLMLALVAVIMTFVAMRNIPGVMEIVVLRHLPFDAGSRYAITTITRYIIIGVGVLTCLSILGFSWTSLQWLVAALSVGIGFGLQEIVANFVSGLILLFERPIRVGDTVTVGSLDGTVSRIRIRATTIINWDRKELVIPNKNFITGELINWTLSDPIIRIVIPVGIAYGSDTDLAVRLMEQVARKNHNVLEEPSLRVLFLDFGESALNFELRVFIRGINNLMDSRHALHMAVDKIFRKHGIEIAFPQRDIHLRSVHSPLWMRETDKEGNVYFKENRPAGGGEHGV